MSSRGLGSGFDALIPTENIDSFFDPTASEDKKESQLRDIKIDDIIPDKDQPRREFKQEQLEALADSIREHGVLQPLVLTKAGGKYKIVAGERRWRASKMVGLEKVPAIIRTLDAQNRLELSLIENVQREDLNAIEIATAYAKLRDQFNMTPAEIAKRVGKSEPAVVNKLRLLTLPDDIKHAMVENGLSEGQMRPLIPASPENIRKVLPKIIKENWSARKVEQYMVEQKASIKATKQAKVRTAESTYDAKAEKLSQHLGVKVKIHASARGTGNIVLKFKNEKEFEDLCSTLMM